MSDNWTIPKNFPKPLPPHQYPGMVCNPVGPSHAAAVSRAITASPYTRPGGWDVKVSNGRVVVRVGDHDADRISSALSAARYSFYSFGNGTDVHFFHVRGKYTATPKAKPSRRAGI